jgi:hypothetical protein
MSTGRFSIDLIGQTFNRWTVLARTDRRAGNGSFYWQVRCECGNEAEVYTQSLISGKSKSCGCYGRENSKTRMTKHGAAKRGSPGYQAYVRKIHEKRKYGLTPEIKQQLLWQQHDACAICGYEFGQKLGDYHIDHCHKTGNVRGILCDRCNRGLGYFRDTPSFLQNAASYLRPQGNTGSMFANLQPQT